MLNSRNIFKHTRIEQKQTDKYGTHRIVLNAFSLFKKGKSFIIFEMRITEHYKQDVNLLCFQLNYMF